MITALDSEVFMMDPTLYKYKKMTTSAEKAGVSDSIRPFIHAFLKDGIPLKILFSEELKELHCILSMIIHNFCKNSTHDRVTLYLLCLKSSSVSILEELTGIFLNQRLDSDEQETLREEDYSDRSQVLILNQYKIP